MGNKDYENYNRSYSSKDYQSNTEEHRFGQDISNNTFGSDDSNAKKYNNSRNSNRFICRTPSKPKPQEFSLTFVIVVALVIMGGLCVVFLPQILEARNSVRKPVTNLLPFLKKNDSKKAIKSQSETEAEKFGLNEAEYIALKGLDKAGIEKKIEDVTLSNKAKRYLTVKAIESDYVIALEKLIDSGYDIEAKDDNNASLLYIAVRNNSEKCAYFLINKGANIKAETKDGDTVLHAAAYNGNFEIVKQAIMSGIPVDKLGAGRKTPLYRAAQANQQYVCRMLMLAGAKRLPDYSKVTDDLNLKNYFLTGKGNWSPSDNDSSKSKFRGNQGPDLEEKEKERWARVSRFIQDGKISELLKIVPNAEDYNSMSMYELPPACIAVKFGQLEILKYLKSVNCYLLEPEKSSGKTALHYAAQLGKDDIVEFLLANTNCDLNQKDNFNNTALHYSVLAPIPFVTERLLKSGADPNSINLKLQTPLHMAVEKSNVLGAKLLLKYGTNINQQDYAGNTAFHYVATRADMKEMIDAFYVYEDKLDTTIKNNEGKTARECQRWDYLKFYDEHYRK